MRMMLDVGVLLLLVTWGTSLSAQGSIEVTGKVTDMFTNQKYPGAEIAAFVDGQPYDAVQTLGNGRFRISLDHGVDYELVFSCRDLGVRKLEINASTIPGDFQDQVMPVTADMQLFAVPFGFDASLLDLPAGRLAWDPSKQEIGWDLDYILEMRQRIESELEAAGDPDSAGGASASNREYEEHMRKAEVEFGRGRWAQSINWLERALQEVPGDVRAESMMDEAAENLARAEEEAATAAEFSRLMREGQIKMKRKDWTGARTAIEAAAELRPDDPEPVELLAEIEAELGSSEEADSEEEDGAAAAMEARENAARQRDYDRLIARADKSFERQDYAEAKRFYEQATKVLPNETYPFDRIAEANARLSESAEPQQEPETNANRDTPSGPDRAYEDRVREGDMAFDAQNWEQARAAYEAALELKPEERYPKNRLRRLEKLMEDTSVEAEMTVDTESRLQDEADEIARSEAAANQLADEQARLLEAEREAAEADEARRRERAQAATEAGLDRSRNYLLALQSSAEDDAEAYYRNALESEIRARAQSVDELAERTEAQARLWAGNHTDRRETEWSNIQARTTTIAEAEYDAAQDRKGRQAQLDIEVQVQEERNLDMRERANALRRDRFILLEEDTKSQRRDLYDRTRRYDTFVDSLERILQAYASFNQDLRRASVDSRIMRYEEIQRDIRQHQKLGEGSEARRLDNLLDLREAERSESQSRRAASGEAELRSAEALREAQGRYSGAPLTSEDYNEVEANQDIREGVEERSYEEGNALIIERTVRVGNEVNVYRKTVAKHGVYYFKNNQSITRDIWILETFEITD